jgi:hypothetical protein
MTNPHADRRSAKVVVPFCYLQKVDSINPAVNAARGDLRVHYSL